MPLVESINKYKCSRCALIKERSAFYTRRRGGIEAPQGYCKACVKEYSQARRAWESRLAMNRYYKKRYGITLEEYETLLSAQGGVCAICKKRKGKNRLHVDHCHSTGNIRGILCSWCNAGLGQFKDDTAMMLRAVEYLRRHAA